MKKIIISLFVLALFILVGCDVQTIEKVTVEFDTDDGSYIAPVVVDKGSCIEQPEDPVKENYEFIGWYFNDVEFDFATPIEQNMVLNAMYELIEVKDQYTVTFINYNGTVLKEEIVEKGKSATPPETPIRDGYIFTGWIGNYENVTGNITIRAQYSSKDQEYKIYYNMNNGVFGYGSKKQFVLLFLKDFYEFVQPSEDLNTFIYGEGNGEFLGTWVKYIGGYVGEENLLLYDNNINANNEEYFFNCKTYKEKWKSLAIWVGTLNTRFAGSDYYYGALDFYRYIINDPDQYINVYGERFYEYPEIVDPFDTYKYSEEDIVLPVPLSETFKGWYLNSDFSGSPVTVIEAGTIGNIELFACWDTTITYEIYFNTDGAGKLDPITVQYNQEISLPTNLVKEGFTFKGWYLNDDYIGTNIKFDYPCSITLVAKWKSDTVTMEQLLYNGNPVYYRNSKKAVEIPSEYVQPKEQLRATWISSYASTFTPSPNEANMKNALLKDLQLLEEFNMNCMIFHIRTTNNAFYQTDLAPIDPEYGTYESFEKWDYLTWLIDECHKRGIEFHAWLNPYRIKATGFPAGTTPEDVALLYKDYPKNPASNPDNILITYRSDGQHGAILNPCKEEVQDYIVQVCLEVMEKYDVDAIHFDDYFYAQMSPNITVLTEPDQDDYELFIKNNPSSGYSKSNANDKKQWRRDNIDNFIYKLYSAMTDFNIQNGKGVQLGISPTGIYRNGNGSVTSGSNTAGQEHYSSYLFCDTVNWINNEWIDYIMPQSYWAFTHSVAGYADVMDWWNSVVEGKKVNLYSGIGIYMSVSGGNYSWGVQPYEVSNQILYTTKLSNVKGVSFYSFKSIRQVYTSSSQIANLGLMRIKNEYWTEKVKTPSTRASEYIPHPGV